MLELEGTSEDWIAALPANYSKTIGELQDEGKDYEEIAVLWLSKAGPDNNFPFGAQGASKGAYERVMDEIVKLVCGDPAYNDLRAQFAALQKHKGKAIAAVSSVIAAKIGIAAAVLLPIVGLFLSLVSAVGVNAWCASKHDKK